jgi:hypothetical protein
VASGGANLYALRPYVVVGQRRPSEAEWPCLTLILGLCRTLYTNFGELPFHALR